MDAVGDPACYLVEWYLPELTEKSVDDMVARLDAAAAWLTSKGTPIRLLVTLAVPTDEVLYGVFDARSRDVVSQACAQAGSPHNRLTEHIGARIYRGLPNVAS